jgi:hypothetical protein
LRRCLRSAAPRRCVCHRDRRFIPHYFSQPKYQPRFQSRQKGEVSGVYQKINSPAKKKRKRAAVFPYFSVEPGTKGGAKGFAAQYTAKSSGSHAGEKGKVISQGKGVGRLRHQRKYRSSGGTAERQERKTASQGKEDCTGPQGLFPAAAQVEAGHGNGGRSSHRGITLQTAEKKGAPFTFRYLSGAGLYQQTEKENHEYHCSVFRNGYRFHNDIPHTLAILN